MDRIKIVADLLQRPLGGVTLETALSDIEGLDSLAMVRLMMRLEQHMGRELTEDEMAGLVLVGDVNKLLSGN